MSDDEGPFARWSRRKRRSAAETEAEAPGSSAQSSPEEIPEPATPEDEAELLHQLDLPVPETLTAGDDFSVFMKSSVPEFLRKRALRVLWTSNPMLANLDGLNDYDDDFTAPELTQKVLATGYKIGRGFLPEEPIPEVLQDEGANRDDDDAGQIPDEQNEGPVETEAASLEVVEPIDAEVGVPDAELSFHPRRMRFRT